MLSNEKIFLLQILKDFIHEDKTVSGDGIDYDMLQLYGKKHEVLGIIYYQTRLPQFSTVYSSTLYTNVNREKILKEIVGELDFPYFIVKGSTVAGLYPKPTLRTMGDTDLVVPSDKREVLHELLLKKGYVNQRKGSREWTYFKNQIEFEIHNKLVYEAAINNPKQEAFFNDFWGFVKDNQLDWNFHFLFLVSHLRKHFMNEGVGLRQFMDIAIVAKFTDLDWDWIKEKAELIELLPFLRVVLSFCERWFEIITPVETVSLDDNFYETATNKIFDDGVFGLENEENRGSLGVNEYRKNGIWGIIKRITKVLFPSYKALRVRPEYSFVDGKPYLVPIAWVYRAIKGRRRTEACDLMKETITSTEQIKKREEMYKQWGL